MCAHTSETNDQKTHTVTYENQRRDGDVDLGADDFLNVPPPPEPACKREKALCTLSIGVHSISFYGPTSVSTARYEAVCRNPDHGVPIGRCRLTRHIHDKLTDPDEGRPVGKLVTWLLASRNFLDKDEHENKFMVACLLPEECLKNRIWVKTQPNATKLLSFERERREGEGEEPGYE